MPTPWTLPEEITGSEQPQSQRVSTLELLQQNNQEMEELLASIEGFFLEAYILEKQLVKEFEGGDFFGKSSAMPELSDSMHFEYQKQKEGRVSNDSSEFGEAPSYGEGERCYRELAHQFYVELYNLEC